MTFVSTDTNCGFFQLFMYIDVVYLRLLDTVTINLREFTYIMSTAILT